MLTSQRQDQVANAQEAKAQEAQEAKEVPFKERISDEYRQKERNWILSQRKTVIEKDLGPWDSFNSADISNVINQSKKVEHGNTAIALLAHKYCQAYEKDLEATLKTTQAALNLYDGSLGDIIQQQQNIILRAHEIVENLKRHADLDVIAINYPSLKSLFDEIKPKVEAATRSMTEVDDQLLRQIRFVKESALEYKKMLGDDSVLSSESPEWMCASYNEENEAYRNLLSSSAEQVEMFASAYQNAKEPEQFAAYLRNELNKLQKTNAAPDVLTKSIDLFCSENDAALLGLEKKVEAMQLKEQTAKISAETKEAEEFFSTVYGKRREKLKPKVDQLLADAVALEQLMGDQAQSFNHMSLTAKQESHLDKLKSQLDDVFRVDSGESKGDYFTVFTRLWNDLITGSNTKYVPSEHAHDIHVPTKKGIMLQRVATLFHIAKQLDTLESYSKVELITKLVRQFKDRIVVDDFDKRIKKTLDEMKGEITALDQRVNKNELDADIHHEELNSLRERLELLKTSEIKLSSPAAPYGEDAVHEDFEALKRSIIPMCELMGSLSSQQDKLNKETAQSQASASKKYNIKKQVEDEVQWCSVVDNLFAELAKVQVSDEKLQEVKRQFDTLFTEFYALHRLSRVVGSEQLEEKVSNESIKECLNDIAKRGQELSPLSVVAPQVGLEALDLGLLIGLYIPREIKSYQEKLQPIESILQKQQEKQQAVRPKNPPSFPLIAGGLFGGAAGAASVGLVLFALATTNPIGWVAAGLMFALLASALVIAGSFILIKNGLKRAERKDELRKYDVVKPHIEAALETRYDELRNESTMTRELRIFTLREKVLVERPRKDDKKPEAKTQSDDLPCAVKRKVKGQYVDVSLVYAIRKGKFLFKDEKGEEDAQVNNHEAFEAQCLKYKHDKTLRAGG